MALDKAINVRISESTLRALRAIAEHETRTQEPGQSDVTPSDIARRAIHAYVLDRLGAEKTEEKAAAGA